MKFWKEHMALRSLLILIFVGVILLLTALLLYNKPFEDPKVRK